MGNVYKLCSFVMLNVSMLNMFLLENSLLTWFWPSMRSNHYHMHFPFSSRSSKAVINLTCICSMCIVCLHNLSPTCVFFGTLRRVQHVFKKVYVAFEE